MESQTGRRRAPWLLLAAALGAAAAVLLLLARVPLGVRGEWPVTYAPEHGPAVLAEAVPAAAALVVVAVVGLWAFDRYGGRRPVRWPTLAALGVSGFFLAVLICAAGPAGVTEPAYRTVFNAGIGSYLTEAEHIGPFRRGGAPREGLAAPNPIAYLARFHERVAAQPLTESAFRVAVHPPGMTLVVWAVDYTWRSGIRRRGCAAARFRRTGWAGIEAFLPPGRRPSGRALTGLTLPLLGALAVVVTALVVYAFAVDLGASRPAAFGAAALWLTVPSVLLHAPALDQGTPFVALLVAWCWLRACVRRSVVWAVLAGVAAWVGLFFTLAMAAVVFGLAAGTAAHLAALWRNPRALRLAAKRGWPPAAWAAGTFLLISVAAWLTLDYHVVLVLKEVARRNAEWNATVGARSYAAWLAWNPVMFALFLGPAATAVWLAGTGRAVRGVRDERLAAAAIGLIITILVLWLSGQNRGEVERLWSFLMAPALAVGMAGVGGRDRAGDRPAKRAPDGLRLSALPFGSRLDIIVLIILQLAVLFVLRYRVDVQNVLTNLPGVLTPLPGGPTMPGG